MYRDTLETAISEVLKARGVAAPNVILASPVEPTHGDYTTNAALAYAKELGVAPRALAEDVVAAIRPLEDVAHVDIAGPGFVNITLKNSALGTVLRECLTQGNRWGENVSQKGKHILIEKSAPNLFKPFHVGHLLNITIGEALSRLLRFSGATVHDVAYPSDISLGVAKGIWSLLTHGVPEPLTVHDLGKAYVDGTRAYDEDETAKAAIIAINQKLNAGEDGPELELYKKGREINLAYFTQVTGRLGSVFDDTFFESASGAAGKDIVRAHVGDVFTESNGAIIFEGEKYGLHTRVFLTSLGLPVYEAKDIGLLKLKFEKYNPDLSIVITDVEQKQYFEVIKQAATLIDPAWGEHSVYWQHGRLRFEGGKISSRYGNVPLAEDVVEAIRNRVEERVMQSMRVTTEEEKASLTEHVALGAFKYAFLKPAAGHNIVFDFERSVSIEGDSGPYVQYAYARARSILAAAHEAGVTLAPGAPETDEERLVARLLMQFPDAVARAQSEYAPHHVAQYVGELAASYNRWYAKERVVGDPAAARRAALTQAVAITLKNGLYLLGIQAPERM